jgi:hypothetical protein
MPASFSVATHLTSRTSLYTFVVSWTTTLAPTTVLLPYRVTNSSLPSLVASHLVDTGMRLAQTASGRSMVPSRPGGPSDSGSSSSCRTAYQLADVSYDIEELHNMSD